MKGKFINLLMALMLTGTILASGCHKEPEAIVEDGILHAKSNTDSQVQDIINQTKNIQKEKEETDSGRINCKLGTEENGIKINAELPKLPTKAYELTLKPNEKMNKDMLLALLDSDSGHVKDITKEIMPESETELEGGEGFAEFPGFQDDSILVLADGKKQAGFSGHTGIQYEDTNLMDKCNTISKEGKETIIFSSHSWEKKENEKLEFSSRDAQKLLMEKLAAVEIEEIHIYEVTLYESNDSLFYEIFFTPSHQGIGVAHDGFESIKSGEVAPSGIAWIMKEGVVFLECSDFCGTISQKSEQTDLLNFTQVKKILETYLDNNTICGSWKITMSHIEFLYYPILLQREKSLKLIPVWNICIPLKEIGEQNIGFKVTNIYINAVTGKIEGVK